MRLDRTVQAAVVSRREESQHINQGEHEQGTNQRAQLHRCPTPQEGTAAPVTQDQTQHHLDVAEAGCKQHPGEHLRGTRPAGEMQKEDNCRACPHGLRKGDEMAPDYKEVLWR